MKLHTKLLSNIPARRELTVSLAAVLLIFFGTFHPIFSIAAFGLCCAAMMYMRKSYFLCLLFLIMPLAGIFKLSPNSTSLFTYLELLYVIWHIYKQKFRISIGELLALLFLAYISITALAWATIPVTNTIKSVVNLMLIGYFAELDMEKEDKQLFLCYILGILISSFIRLANSSMFPIADYVTDKTETFQHMMTIVRFSGLYGDPNYYSINVIIAMCLTILLYRRRKLNFPVTACLFTALLIFVGMTGSKSSFLMLVFPILLLLYTCLKNRNYIALILCILAFLAVVVLVEMGSIQIFDYVLLRLTNTGTSTESFTTGRSELWWQYTQYLKRHPLLLIFGSGSAFFTLNGHAPHNTYLDFVFQFGILGTILYGVTVLYLVKKAKPPIKRNLLNYSVLAVVMIMYFFLSELLCIDLPFHIALFFCVYNLQIAEPYKRHRI